MTEHCTTWENRCHQNDETHTSLNDRRLRKITEPGRRLYYIMCYQDFSPARPPEHTDSQSQKDCYTIHHEYVLRPRETCLPLLPTMLRGWIPVYSRSPMSGAECKNRPTHLPCQARNKHTGRGGPRQSTSSDHRMPPETGLCFQKQSVVAATSTDKNAADLLVFSQIRGSASG